jgi:hypothetical protein
MLQVTRIWRRIEVTEDADLPCELSVPTEAYEDAMEHAVRLDEIRPAWHCDDCGQKWPGDDCACGYCGRTRSDVDL